MAVTAALVVVGVRVPGPELEVAGKVPGPELVAVGSLPAQVVVLVLRPVFAHLGAVSPRPAGRGRQPLATFAPAHAESLPLGPGPLPFFRTFLEGTLLARRACYLGQFFESHVLTTG